MENSNYAWIVKQNTYDLLCKIQDYMDGECGRKHICVIDAVTGEDSVLCRYGNKECKACIGQWLQDTNFRIGGIYGSSSSGSP